MTAPTTNEASDDDLQTIAAIVASAKIALLTTTTLDGHLHSRPLAVQDAEYDGELWFFTQDPSRKVDDIRTHPQVNAAFESDKGFLSIAGRAELVHDRAKIDELWSPQVSAWFPEGKDDPTVGLLRVVPESAEYWSDDTPNVAKVFKIAKAAVTGGQPDIGENRSVEL